MGAMSGDIALDQQATQILPASADLSPIAPGASLLIALRLERRPVLLIGGGAVASSRLYFLLEADAHITLISPTLCADIRPRLITNTDQITWLPREYLGRMDPVKVEDFTLVLTAIDNNALSLEVCQMCREHRVIVNVADVPPQCDFYFGAQLRRGPLQVMVSTQGQSPKIGVMVRDRIAKLLPNNLESAIEGVGRLRQDLRMRAPGVGGELSKQRMEWMKATCDAWSLDDMTQLCEENSRKRLLDEGWENRSIIGPHTSSVAGALSLLHSTFWSKVWVARWRDTGVGILLGGLVTAFMMGRAR